MTAYRIDVPQDELDDLRRRLLATRWPDAVADDWSQGTSPAALARLLEHWSTRYDWRAAEARLNAYAQVKVGGIHALRAGTPGGIPLLLLHGWPDSFMRFLPAVPHLGAFDLVIPSIPGYGFSDRPTSAEGPAVIADRMAALMTELGFDAFGVHGGDIGTHIADQLGTRHPHRLIGLHLGDLPLRRMRALDPAVLSDDERAWVNGAAAWDIAEGAYGHQQRTKPQTLAAALTDSPAGLASWFLEKFESWSEDSGVFDLDDLCTNLTIYWVTRTAGSAARYYLDARTTALSDGYVDVPTAVAQAPADLLPGPRSAAERWFRVVRWTELPAGGHFAPWEQPGPWAADVTEFFASLRG